MSKNKELLPCPFCGGEAKLFEESNNIYQDLTGFIVRCTNNNCDLSFKTKTLHITENWAIEAWNTRYTPSKSYDELLEEEWEEK